jgi:ribonuclease P protein component
MAEGRPRPSRPPADPDSDPPRQERREALGAEDRLRRRAEFLRCYQEGRRRHGPLATLHYATNAVGRPRLGITASRKVGGAVARARLKRRTREIFRRWGERPRLPALDLVVHLKPAAAGADFTTYRRELERLLGGVLPARREAP